MLGDVLSYMGSQQSRPLSIAAAVLALFAPGSLLIFNARPDLFSAYGVHGVVLLSIGISAPVLLLCYSISWTPLSGIREMFREKSEGPIETRDFETVITEHDPLEWPCLIMASWLANGVLFSVATLAYFRPIRIGATMVLVSVILFLLWFLIAAFTALVRHVANQPEEGSEEAPA